MDQEPNPALLRIARQLAATGRHAAATALLDVADTQGASPPSRSLRARILAQQGRYIEAASVWRESLRVDPDDGEARAGIARAERASRSRWHRTSGGFKVALSAGLLLALGTLAAAVHALGPASARFVASESASALRSREAGATSSAEAASAVRPVREVIESQTTISPIAESKAVEQAVQRQTAALTAEIAALRDELAQSRHDGPQPDLDRQLDALAARIDGWESVQREQESSAETRIAAIEEAVSALRTDQLIGQALELSNRRPLGERDLEALIWIARKLLLLDPEPEMQQYARQLISWAEARRSSPSRLPQP